MATMTIALTFYAKTIDCRVARWQVTLSIFLLFESLNTSSMACKKHVGGMRMEISVDLLESGAIRTINSSSNMHSNIVDVHKLFILGFPMR